MSIEASENFTYLEVQRRAIADKDLKSFCDRVRFYGEKVFGKDFSSMIIDESGENEDGVAALKGIGPPRLEVYPSDKIRLPLFERRAKPKKHYQGRYLESSTLFDLDIEAFQREPDSSRGRAPLDDKRYTLVQQLTQSGHQYDVVDQSRIIVECDNLQFRADADRDLQDGIELALVPSTESPIALFLVEQADICFRALAGHSRRSAYPTAPTAPNIPFARLPIDVTTEEQPEFIKRVKSLLPLRVILGCIQPSFGIRNDTK